MKIRRDLIIVALATFCLTASIFMVVPTRSNPTGLGEYDPWVDNNEDGTIDIFDAIGLAGVYGTSGDPTKNVNVTNWPTVQNVNGSSQNDYYLQYETLNFTNEHQGGPVVWCGGYSRLSLLVIPRNASIGPDNNITVYLQSRWWISANSSTPIPMCYEWNDLDGGDFNFTMYTDSEGSYTGFDMPIPYVTETKAPYCYVTFATIYGPDLPANWWIAFEICAYLRNE